MREPTNEQIDVVPSKRLGRPPKLPVVKRVLILLLKDIFQLSNRKMATLLPFFKALNDVEISYKTVERIYSDKIVHMVLHNMHQILVADKKIESTNSCGDGTGYSLSVTKHYRNEREKDLKNKRKSNQTKQQNDKSKVTPKKKVNDVLSEHLH